MLSNDDTLVSAISVLVKKIFTENRSDVHYFCVTDFSYEKDLKSVNTRSNLYICILILNQPAGSQEV